MRILWNMAIALVTVIVFVSPALANDPPVLFPIGAQSVGEGVTLKFGIEATDGDSDSLTFIAEDIPTNATFVDNGDSTGTFQFKPYCDQAGVYDVRFIVSDGALADTEIVEITVTEKPVFSIHTRGGYEVVEGTLLTFPVWANDCEGETPSLEAQSLPPGATFVDNGDGTGTFDDFIPDIGTAGTKDTVLFIADDGVSTTDKVVWINTVTDFGLRDTLRLEIPGVWEILSLEPLDDDSTYTVEIWAWADDDNITAVSIPLALTMSGPHYTPERFDSQVVVDTFIYDAAWEAMMTFIQFSRSVLKNDVDYHAGSTQYYGFNGLILGGANLAGTSIFNIGTPTKLGDLILKIRHPEMLPLEFTIEIDSRYYPPAGAFKYSPKNEMGHPPYFEKVTITVDNSAMDAEEDLGEIKPESYSLSQNTPNPFNPSTTISFYNEAKGHVNLAIYNLLGQKVKTLIDWDMAPGQQDVLWDGTNDNGENISSGLYFYRLSAGEFHDIKKMMLLK